VYSRIEFIKIMYPGIYLQVTLEVGTSLVDRQAMIAARGDRGQAGNRRRAGGDEERPEPEHEALWATIERAEAVLNAEWSEKAKRT
jgi:hypothetical protein